MLKLLAIINLYSEGGGVFTKEGFSGMRPSFNVGDESILSEVWSLNGEEWLKLGERHEVQINLSYGERYLEKIVPGMKFKLQVASRIIGEGEVIAVE